MAMLFHLLYYKDAYQQSRTVCEREDERYIQPSHIGTVTSNCRPLDTVYTLSFIILSYSEHMDLREWPFVTLCRPGSRGWWRHRRVHKEP